MGLGYGIRDPRSGIWKKPIPDPGSRGQKGTGSWIPDPGSRIWIRNTGNTAKKSTKEGNAQTVAGESFRELLWDLDFWVVFYVFFSFFYTLIFLETLSTVQYRPSPCSLIGFINFRVCWEITGTHEKSSEDEGGIWTAPGQPGNHSAGYCSFKV